jgi:sulfide:quinone oxidoreductase
VSYLHAIQPVVDRADRATGKRTEESSNEQHRRSGRGIGGLSAAFELKDELGTRHEIVLVSDQDVFEFTPSNPWVAVNWRKPEAIRLDLRALMPKHGIRFVGSGARRVQPESHSLLLENGEELRYDYLVIATGPRLAFDEVPGLGPHGEVHAVGMQDRPPT